MSLGLVIRRDAIDRKGLSLEALAAALEFEAPLDVGDDFATFGPCFGDESLQASHDRLIAMGFIYWDEFFDLSVDVPDWATFSVALTNR